MEPLSVPGELQSLTLIRDFVDRAAAAAGLEQGAGYRLKLAVDEIATNIITYGYQDAGLEGNLDLSARIDDQTLTIAIEDTADPYDPTAAEEPDHLEAPLDERPIGGLGIFLAVRGVDKFQYERVDNRNRNVFVMTRPSSWAERETA